MYQRGPRRCCAGTGVMYSPASPDSRQFCEMWRSSECDLYCVSTQIRRYRALTRLDSTKSISRYAPPKGTAGLARSAVSGYSRLPSPPARTMPSTCGNSLMVQTYPQARTAASHWHHGSTCLAHRAFGGLSLKTSRCGSHDWRISDTVDTMRVAMMTREYPPEVYGGAGVTSPSSSRSCAICAKSTCTAWARRATGRSWHSPIPRCWAPTRRLSTLSADLTMANAARPGHRRAFAHLVRRPGRPPRRAAVRHPACADRAFARADAAVEGRTARRRLPGVVVGGEHRGRGRRCGDRGQFGHARRRAAHLSRAGPEPGACGAQRDRHRCLVPGASRGGRRIGARRTRRRPDAADRRVRRADHPAEGRRRI